MIDDIANISKICITFPFSHNEVYRNDSVETLMSRTVFRSRSLDLSQYVEIFNWAEDNKIIYYRIVFSIIGRDIQDGFYFDDPRDQLLFSLKFSDIL